MPHLQLQALRRKKTGLLFLVLLGCGCTTVSSSQGTAYTGPPAPLADTGHVGTPAAKDGLTQDILYQLLVAEFAGQRDMLDVSVKNYLDLARKTRDLKITERATRIAVFARDSLAATEAASLWVELRPNAADPYQVLAIMSIRAGNVEESLQHLEAIMRMADGSPDQKLWMIANFLGREQDQAVVIMEVMDRLMRNYMDDADAVFSYAQIAARLGEMERARQLFEHLLELEPDNDDAAMNYIALLQRQDRSSEAVIWIEGVLDKKQDNFTLQHAYARLLTDLQRFDEARRQFEILSIQAPNNPDILYALGLLYLQVDRLDQAKTYFLRLTNGKKKVNDANYYLGRITEKKNNLERAIHWYEGVHGGENYFDARIRMSLILAQQDDIDAALENIRSMQARSFDDRLLLIQAEAEVLTEAERYEEALDVFNTAIIEKTHPDLLYSRAMLAEKMDRLDILEQDLNAILEDEPDNVQALNALGYTLANKTDRYGEAHELVRKALELSPDNFYILDSMGWVLYRLGRLAEAVVHLRKALELRHDPEIAAHLGEVLWVMGDRQAAKQIWETALQDTPEHNYLLEVMQRFDP